MKIVSLFKVTKPKKNTKQQEPHEKVREVFNLSNSSLQNHFPQVFFWETKKKNGEVAPKRLFRWRVGVRKGRRLAGAIQVPLGEKKVVGMKSEIQDLFLLGCVFFSLVMKLSVFLGGGLRY